MYKCVIFDMDGTLVDSFEGIYNAYAWTMERMGLTFGGRPFVEKAIGAPLPYVFERLCGLRRDEAARAIQIYRDYYAGEGRRQVRAYDGMEEVLARLRRAGCFLGAATLKRESFAKEMLEALSLLPYFHIVCGMDADDRLTKADLVRRCLAFAGIRREEAVLVGDSAFDAKGAEEAGVDFLAVTYGFGYRDDSLPAAGTAVFTARYPLEIPAFVCADRK